MIWKRDQMAARAARERREAFCVDPGIDPFPYAHAIEHDLINAGKQTITALPAGAVDKEAGKLDLPETGPDVTIGDVVAKTGTMSKTSTAIRVSAA